MKILFAKKFSYGIGYYSRVRPIIEMNELDLIREVEKRPILYDKSVSGFNKTKLRDEAWREVQDALNTTGATYSTEAECKKRWRSLRDSYIKLQRTHGGRTRWPYVFAMKFLKPHVINEPRPEEFALCPCIFSQPADSDTEDDSNKARGVQCLPDLSFIGDTNYGEDNEISPETLESTHETSQPSPKRARLSSSDEENNCLCNRNDPDELFLLSCAPTLKRLTPKQNATARLKIQQALYESEFGSQPVSVVDLPFVTPVSDCSFEGALQ